MADCAAEPWLVGAAAPTSGGDDMGGGNAGAVDLVPLAFRAVGIDKGCVAEYRFAPPRRFRFDFAWPEEKVALEVEGGAWTGGRHVRAKGFLGDMEKYNAAAMQGWRVFRCTPQDMQTGRAATMIAQALGRSYAKCLGPGCGRLIEVGSRPGGRRTKKFCSGACRVRAHRGVEGEALD